MHLGPVKKSLSIERRAGSVAEQFTPKVLYQGIKLTQQQQQLILEELHYLRQRDTENSKIIKSHGRSLDFVQKAIENSTIAAGDQGMQMRDLQEQLTTSIIEIQKSIDTSFSRLQTQLGK